MFANNHGYLFLVLLGASLILCALFLLRNHIRKLFTHYPARETLINRVLHLRLGKMLAKRNINLRQYFFSQSSTDISRHIHSCDHCDSTVQCDDFLSDDALHDVDNVPFCPNHDAIMEAKQAQQDMKIRTRKTGQSRYRILRALSFKPLHCLTKK